MNLEPYRRYKPSGIDWLGEVPEHWDTLPLKRAYRIKNGGTPVSGEQSYWDGDITWITPEDLGRNENKRILHSRRTLSRDGLRNSGARLIPCDSIVLSTRAPIGHVAVTGVEACTNQGCRALVPVTPFAVTDFVYYGLLAACLVLKASGKGTTFMELAAGALGTHAMAFPPPDEQLAIANFLDRETTKLDTLVARKRTLIERLKEKRAALISRTVTRGLPPNAATACGLNPDPKLKPSGIDWLGDVPEHWEVKQLRRLARLQSGEAITTEEMEDGGNYPVYGGNGIRGFTTNFTHCGEFILIGRQGAQCGNINYASTEFWASEHAIVVSPIEGWSTRWMGELLRTMNLNQYSQSAAQPGLSVDRILVLSLPVPPSCEQHTIANFIEHETAKINRLVAKIEIAIERLKEYRTALITAAVTGKINVRKADIEVKGEQS